MTIATSPSIWILSTLAATLGFWTCFGACVDAPMPPPTPQAKILASWDPLACGDPHRVVVELEDEAGVPLSTSAPCTTGGFSIDAPHFGVYRGRIYAWVLGGAERPFEDVNLVVDQPVVRWDLQTPK